MSNPPPSILLATTLGLALSTSFTIGSLSLTYFAIPSILLPSTAPLMPPLDLVAPRSERPSHTRLAPKTPTSSGTGDEKETTLDAGATHKILRTDAQHTGSPSSTSYLLRQWFHLFSKGMHALPPCVLGSAACYAFCGVMLPGPLLRADGATQVKRVWFGLAAVLSVGAMVFTLTALKPVNEALHERVREVVAKEEGRGDANADAGGNGDVDDKRRETEVLIRRWGLMNAYRACIPIAAVMAAVVGLVL